MTPLRISGIKLPDTTKAEASMNRNAAVSSNFGFVYFYASVGPPLRAGA